jgi:acetyl/propionyl-CoA carboxylase alpha subunit
MIANRGEIAVRIARTLHAMGIETVAVYSDADRSSLHVRACDRAYYIGGSAPADSYLNGDAIIEAALNSGAQAVHPGFGFLSENAAFARAVVEAGLIFVGPAADVIDAMGSKEHAKELARKAGVPVVPGEVADDTVLGDQAARIGYPILLKASAGGGGKGMQIVRYPDALSEASSAARRTAKAAFGDDTLLIEKYIERPRHIEIQVFGDAHGNVVHLFERECSIQRRYQKIIEESPSMAVSDELRAQMGESAASLAREIGYQGAGTVEFIVSPTGEYYFLEVNTRLQVEHPVTELVTGLDLVAEQIRVASGQPLSDALRSATQTGWAMEARLYAEDPAAGYLPDAGRLLRWSIADDENIRVDTGVEAGDEVTSWYDPMIAKVIAWGEDRATARARLLRALGRAEVAGVATNRDLLIRILSDADFAAGDLHTHFLDDRPSLAAGDDEAPTRLVLAAVAAVAMNERVGFDYLPGLRPGFRLFGATWHSCRFVDGSSPVECTYRWLSGTTLAVRFGDEHTVEIVQADDAGIVLSDGNSQRRSRVAVTGDAVWVSDAEASLRLGRVARFPDPGAADDAGGHTAPMTGRVVAIRVAEGDSVSAGDPLVILDAMKMEHTISAAHDGVVAAVRCEVGEQVESGRVLVLLEGDEAAV